MNIDSGPHFWTSKFTFFATTATHIVQSWSLSGLLMSVASRLIWDRSGFSDQVAVQGPSFGLKMHTVLWTHFWLQE